MIALVFVVCLQTDPTHCEERNLLFASGRLSERRCLFSAQFRLAEWAQIHPRWRIGRWTCRPVGESTTL